jgi:hypothetical protein
LGAFLTFCCDVAQEEQQWLHTIDPSLKESLDTIETFQKRET